MSQTDQSEWRKTGCILCSLNCGLEIKTGGTDGRQILKIRGDKEHPASQGYLCEKPQRLNLYQNADDRISNPLRRRADGTFEEVDWDTAIREITERFLEIKERHGGDKILYYGGGGQGNHLGGVYGNATLKALGVKYRSNALAQEKTGEFWVNGKMIGTGIHGDFHNTDVAVFIGKNPWQSHGFARSRVVIQEIAKDPNRKLVVIDPRVSETAAKADLHLRVKPGTDAWCLAALAGIIVQEDLVDHDWVEEHTDGYDLIAPLLSDVPVAKFAKTCGVSEDLLRETARLIASAPSVAVFEDLGMQMNRHSTLGSYLQRLTWMLTGHFGKKGGTNPFVPFLGLESLSKGWKKSKRKPRRKKRVSPVTGAKIIIGLIPCNIMAEEILADHPDRYRAMLIESGNPVHSVADSQSMREAMKALEFSVVIDVAMTETARLAHYVLPAASQFEKAECTFFNIEHPTNTFQLRDALFQPLPGTLPEAEIHSRLVMGLAGIKDSHLAPLREAAKGSRATFTLKLAYLLMKKPKWVNYLPVILYRTLGEQLPPKLKESAVLWAFSHLYTFTEKKAASNAGYGGLPFVAGERLFKDILETRSGVAFAKTKDYADAWQRVKTPGGRLQLALPELFADIVKLTYVPPSKDKEYPFLLSAGERRSDTTNTIIRDPAARGKKAAAGALRISSRDAKKLKLQNGDEAKLITRRGSCRVNLEVTDTMSSGHISLPNGYGLTYGDNGPRGVAPNELTSSKDRDRIAGTPWHKTVPARLEKITTPH